MNAADLVAMTRLTNLTAGSHEVKIGLVDGPVALSHPDLEAARMHLLGDPHACRGASDAVRAHGTFVAGMLSAMSTSRTPGLCPGCVLLVRPVFCAPASVPGEMPVATPDELAAAIVQCVEAGARVLNLSLALATPTQKGEAALELALNHAVKRGVIVVAAAGNQGTLGTSCITRHPWVIPVAACDRFGRPMGFTNLGASLGRRGLCAPGEGISSLGLDGEPVMGSGTSVAVPFVTAAIALLWSLFPDSSAGQVQFAVTQGAGAPRRSITPPLLNGWAAYQSMVKGRANHADELSHA